MRIEKENQKNPKSAIRDRKYLDGKGGFKSREARDETRNSE